MTYLWSHLASADIKLTVLQKKKNGFHILQAQVEPYQVRRIRDLPENLF
jgi:hypothetical protein